MAILVDTNATRNERLHELQEKAHERNIEISIHPVISVEEIAPAIDMAKASGAKALNVLSSALLY